MNSTDVSVDLTKLLNNMEGNLHLKLIRPLSGGKFKTAYLTIYLCGLSESRGAKCDIIIISSGILRRTLRAKISGSNSAG